MLIYNIRVKYFFLLLKNFFHIQIKIIFNPIIYHEKKIYRQ